MKNGDIRSAAWIKRWLRKFDRDNEALYTWTALIDCRPEVTPEDIARWTDTEALLVEDYCYAIHFSASDNANRVPACPVALLPYRARHMPKGRDIPHNAKQLKAITNLMVGDYVRHGGTWEWGCIKHIQPTSGEWGHLRVVREDPICESVWISGEVDFHIKRESPYRGTDGAK